MQVILLEKVPHLGNLGDLVNVKKGFGRNYLIPQKKAVFATKENIAEFEARRAELERIEQEHLATARSRAEKIQALEKITVTCQVSDEGKLYGSVGAKEVVQAMGDAGVEATAQEIILPSEEKRGIRQVGEYAVIVRLHADVSEQVTLVVAPDADSPYLSVAATSTEEGDESDESDELQSLPIDEEEAGLAESDEYESTTQDDREEE